MSPHDIGYLQHGRGTDGPYRTEAVRVRMEPPFEWFARFEGRWRKVFVQVNSTFIRYRGQRIPILIDGV